MKAKIREERVAGGTDGKRRGEKKRRESREQCTTLTSRITAGVRSEPAAG